MRNDGWDADGIEPGAFYLPVGTVTFMLTDVEGSTRLWESAPESMGAAVPGGAAGARRAP